VTRVLLKIGGAQLESPDARSALCRSIAAARGEGLQVVLVHGGGNQIRDLSRRLDLPDRYHEGLRITDAPTADVALMVLGGLVNRTLVASLQDAGVAAVGLTGADGGSFAAAPHRPTGPDGQGVDLGYVGHVQEMDSGLLETLLDEGYVPVVASVAPLVSDHAGPRDHFYNINADAVAGPLSALLGCGSLVFLTDVPGVRGADGTVAPRLTQAAVEALIADGVITGGMLPKVRAALHTAQTLSAAGAAICVKIAPAAGEDAVREALRADVGTAFTA